jgi:lysophospholipase L1-like esterase
MTGAAVRRVSVLVGAGALVVLAGAPSSSGAQAGYVALGDSYSAGVGTYAPVDDCYRSPYGYPVLLATALGVALNYRSCSGAKTGDVLAEQVGSLSGDTDYVTITIGGNDIGFTQVLTECAKPFWWGDCDGAIDQARALTTGVLPGRLDAVYSAVTNGAPRARFVVAGYPRIFNGQDCNALTFFSPAEETRLNSAADLLSSTIAHRATAHGATYVDVRSAFTGHAVCDDTEWINGLSWPVDESYHPNRAGNVAYANLIGPRLTGQTVRVAPAKPESRVNPAPRQGTETAGTTAHFVVPDITSPESLRAARAAGLNPRDVRHLDRLLRAGDPASLHAAQRDLRRLERQVVLHTAAMAGHPAPAS